MGQVMNASCGHMASRCMLHREGLVTTPVVTSDQLHVKSMARTLVSHAEPSQHKHKHLDRFPERTTLSPDQQAATVELCEGHRLPVCFS